MSVRNIAGFGRRNLHHHRFLQIGLLVAFWAAGELATRYLGLPVPGSIVGLLLVLALLASRLLSPAGLRRGADWFLAEMLLFFIPAVPAILDHREFFGLLGLKILAVILSGTLAVMAVTALVTDMALRWQEAHRSRRHGLE